jgi:dihydroflavonol-4-reductase
MSVAVTGGTGVVGRAVVAALVDAGHRVRGMARSTAAAAVLTRMGAEPVQGSLDDGESVGRLVEGADLVFHVAGVNRLCPSQPVELWEGNVAGTRAVMEACRAAGVGRLVHTSSAVTVGEEAGSIGSESSPHRGHYLSYYERTKTEAERMLLAERGSLDVVIVNPSSVQGPGRSTGTGRMLLEAARGRSRLLVDTTFSLVDIEDCARGHLLAAERGQAGERYLLSGSTLTTRQAVGLIDRLMGRDSRAFFLRRPVFSGLGRLVGAGYAVVGRDAPVCAESVRVLLHGHRYDGSRATRELGLDYTPIDETLSRTIAWFQAEGMLG